KRSKSRAQRGRFARLGHDLSGAILEEPLWNTPRGDHPMRRRELLLGATASMAAPGGLRAQQKAMPVIGQLSVFAPTARLGDLVRGPVHQGLSEMGFVEGQNIVSEYRWAEGHYDRLPALAADLVSRKVDVIITIGGTPPALAAKTATSTIPIVFTG